MSPLLSLGARLVRAGGPLRVASVVVGAAVAVVLLAVAWALPDALYPVVPPDDVDPQRGVLTSLLALIVAPVVALLFTAGRLSSEVRDRRLASLQLLGVGRSRLALVAAVENVIPASLGAGLGVAGFFATTALLDLVLGAELRAPIVGGTRLAVVAVAVVVSFAGVSLASLRRLGRPRTAVSESVRATPSLWRLVPLLVALACFAFMLMTPVEEVDTTTAVVLFLGFTASGVGVALVTPMLSSWTATWLVRRAGVPATIAGRSIQTQPATTGRRVVALGLTVFIAFAAAGYLGVYQSAPYLRYAVQVVESGPQKVGVYSEDPSETLTRDIAPAVATVPGVLSVRPDYPVQALSCGQSEGERCPEPFIGTCEQLAAQASVSGCRNDQAAWITRTTDTPQDAREAPHSVVLEHDSGERRLEIALPGSVTLDVAASERQFVWASDARLFIPAGEAESWHLAPGRLEVSVDPGTDGGASIRQAIDAIAVEHGAYPSILPELYDYEQVVTVRTTVWSIVSIAIAVSLLTFALTTIDRAREARRGRARLIAVGIPARTLRRTQALTNAVPLASSIGIGACLGLLGTSAFSHMADTTFAIDPTVLIIMVAGVVIGALAVSLATLPLTRTTVTAADLRQE